MNGKKLYIIYAAELLLYLLFHFIQIQKGLFGPVFFTGILAVLFLWAAVFLLFFQVRKIRKKEGWKRWEMLFLPLQSVSNRNFILLTISDFSWTTALGHRLRRWP